MTMAWNTGVEVMSSSLVAEYHLFGSIMLRIHIACEYYLRIQANGESAVVNVLSCLLLVNFDQW